MSPTLEKLKGHFAFGLSMYATVRPSVGAYVTKFIKIVLKFHISLDYHPLWSYAPFKGS